MARGVAVTAVAEEGSAGQRRVVAGPWVEMAVAAEATAEAELAAEAAAARGQLVAQRGAREVVGATSGVLAEVVTVRREGSRSQGQPPPAQSRSSRSVPPSLSGHQRAS